jgi:hypothetical protein
MDSLLAGWVDLFGGRQSARTIHFIATSLVVAFVLIHVFEVIITGLWNNLCSMLTGRYRVPVEESHNRADSLRRRRFLGRAVGRPARWLSAANVVADQWLKC